MRNTELKETLDKITAALQKIAEAFSNAVAGCRSDKQAVDSEPSTISGKYITVQLATYNAPVFPARKRKTSRYAARPPERKQ